MFKSTIVFLKSPGGYEQFTRPKLWISRLVKASARAVHVSISINIGKMGLHVVKLIFELLRRRSLLLIKWHTVYWYIIYIELYLLMSFLKMFSMSWIALNFIWFCWCIFFKYNFHKTFWFHYISGVIMLK